MASLPYIQLYVADYLADTMHLSTEEHGAYLLLIFNYWQTGKPIPKNRLQSIVRVGNDRWTTVERSLSEFFNDTGTHWQHSRIDTDLEIANAAQKQRSDAGKASAEAKKRTRQTEIKKVINDRTNDRTNDRSTTVDFSLQRNVNETSTNKNRIEEIREEEIRIDINQEIVPTVLVTADGDHSPESTLPHADKPVSLKPKIPIDEIIATFHEVLPDLPACKKLTTKRVASIRQRWKSGDLPDLKTWRDYFEYVSLSEFLCGKMPPTESYPRTFFADIDFLINESNYTKILEGKYHHGRKQVQPARKISATERVMLDAQARIDEFDARYEYHPNGTCNERIVEIDGGNARRSVG